MWKRFIIVLIFITSISISLSRHHTTKPIYWDGTSYDYDIRQEVFTHRQRAPAETTVQRPIVQYFINILKQTRLPIYSSWNITNPFANIFRPETTTEGIDTSDTVHFIQKKNGNKKDIKRIFLLPYPYGIDPDKSNFFYDPEADQFYEVQHVQDDTNEQLSLHITDYRPTEYKMEQPHKNGVASEFSQISPIVNETILIGDPLKTDANSVQLVENLQNENSDENDEEENNEDIYINDEENQLKKLMAIREVKISNEDGGTHRSLKLKKIFLQGKRPFKLEFALH